MKKEKIVFIGVVVLVAVFGVFWANNNLGITASAVVETDIYRCIDSDVPEGSEVTLRETNLVKGKIRQLRLADGQIVEHEDRCFSKVSVLEFFCNKNGKITSTALTCPFRYGCFDGVCLPK
jgi:hypothetical protein